MARNQAQGYHIAIVLLLLAWVSTCVMAVVYARKFNTAFLQSEKDRADAGKAMQAMRSAEEDMSRLKQWMGFEPTASVADIEKTSKSDFEKYAATLPDAQRTYRAALEATAASLAEAQSTLQITQNENQTLKDRNESREAIKDKQIAEHRAQAEKAEKDLAAEKASYDQARQRLESQKDELALQLKQIQTELDSSRTQYDQDMSKARQTDQLKNEEIKVANRKIFELQGETMASADGVIRQVNQRQKVVWLNLGQADGLKPQVTFSVFGVDRNGVAKGKRKAAVEVTKILGPHMAQANIVEDDFRDPIIKGDPIYTPLWHPHRPERFALVGFMDIDGDDQSDRDVVHELIAMNGGVIDAEVDDQGKETGEMTLNTRYLVVGKEKDNVLEKVGQMKARAEERGVEVLSMEKFLDHIGWKNTNKVLRYDADRYSDFRPPLPDGGVKQSNGYTSKRFQQSQLGQPKLPASAFDRPAAKP